MLIFALIKSARGKRQEASRRSWMRGRRRGKPQRISHHLQSLPPKFYLFLFIAACTGKVSSFIIVCHLHSMMGFKLLWGKGDVHKDEKLSPSVCFSPPPPFPLYTHPLVYMIANNGLVSILCNEKGNSFAICKLKSSLKGAVKEQENLRTTARLKYTSPIHKRHLITLIEGDGKL